MPVGSTFESFLDQLGIKEEVYEEAQKRVSELACQVEEEDRQKLALAEAALIGLTDQCCGSCYWKDGSEACLCHHKFCQL